MRISDWSSDVCSSDLGELSLDARVSPVAGVLPAAVHALGKERGLICPAAQGGEAAWAEGLEILAPGSLIALINHFKGSQVLTPPRPALEAIEAGGLDLTATKGQESARPAPGGAAAGGRHPVLAGPPRAGTTQ